MVRMKFVRTCCEVMLINLPDEVIWRLYTNLCDGCREDQGLYLKIQDEEEILIIPGERWHEYFKYEPPHCQVDSEYNNKIISIVYERIANGDTMIDIDEIDIQVMKEYEAIWKEKGYISQEKDLAADMFRE